MSDVRLARRAQEGDLDAYSVLLRRYQADAQRAAYYVTRHKQDAEDAVQDGFVKAWNALETFNPDRPFRPWLLKIVVNVARDTVRASGRRTRLKLRAVDFARVDVPEPSPEHQILSEERLQNLINEINELSDMDRIMLSYRYFMDLSTVEIAEILDIPGGTVRSRLSQALQRLQNRLRQAERADMSQWERPSHD